MISIGAIIRFWVKFLGFHGFLFGIVLLLAVFTEVITQAAPVTAPRFWFAVGIDILPAIVVVLIMLWLASRFVQVGYDLPSSWEGLQFLIRSRFGKAKFGPFMKINQGQVPLDANKVLTNIGGPGSLIVSNDSVVVLEQGGRLTRVEGPGLITLKPFEKVYDAIDLRPKRWVYPVQAMTREGILITWEVEIRYQIGDDGQQPGEKTPYPFSKDNVFRAVACKHRRVIDGAVDMVDWEGLVSLRTVEALRSVLVNHSLNQLIGPTEVETRAVREAVQGELTRILPQKVNELGVKILGVKLNNLQVHDSLTQQWIKDWQARWQQATASKLEPAETDKFARHEMAMNEARRLLLTTFSNELEKQDSNQAITFMALTYFFFRVEGRMRSEAAAQLFLPN